MGGNFVGWIPNVSGHLSFSHCGTSDSRTLVLNHSAPDGRVILCAQKRVLFDGLIGIPFFKFLYQNDPTYLFVLICQSAPSEIDKLGVLVGQVYVLPIAHWRQPLSSSSVLLRDYVEDAVAHLNDTHIINPSISHIWDDLLNVQEAISNASTYKVDIQIYRNGMTRFTNIVALQSMRLLNSIHIPHREARDTLDEPGDRSYAINQAYFFLKDMFHSHKHHDPKSDTIISAHEEDEEYSWIREAHYSVHRKIVSLRRSRHIQDYFNALGLISYISALTKIAHAKDAENQKLRKAQRSRLEIYGGLSPTLSNVKNSFLEQIKLYNQKEVEDSIKAVIEFKKWRRVQANILLSAAPALLIGLMSVLKPTKSISFAKSVVTTDSLATASGLPDSLFSFIPSFFAKFFTVDIPSAAVLLLMLGCLPFLYGFWNYRNIPLYESTIRILISRPQKEHALIYRSVFFLSFLITPAFLLVPKYFQGVDPIFIGKIIFLTFVGLLLAGFKMLPYFVMIPKLASRLGEIISSRISSVKISITERIVGIGSKIQAIFRRRG